MPNNLLNNVWKRRKAGLELVSDADVFRPITHKDVQLILNKYPFLQIVNMTGDFIEEIKTKFIQSKSEWIIHDYGDAMSSSAGQSLYGGWNDEALLKSKLGKFDAEPAIKKDAKTSDASDEGGGEGGGEDGGKIIPIGTIIKQMFDTSADMVILAIKKKWGGIMIVDGTQKMKWSAWAVAKEKNFSVEGFEPTKEDEEKRRRISQIVSKIIEERITIPFHYH